MMTQLAAQLTSLALLLCLGPPLVAQSASYRFPAELAPGCTDRSGNELVPFVATGTPKLATEMRFTVPASFTKPGCWRWNAAFLMTGTKLRTPIDASGLGICGRLRVSLDIVLATPAGAFGTAVPMRFPIPNSRTLLGVVFHQQVLDMQWFCVLFSQGLLSRAGVGTVGT